MFKAFSTLLLALLFFAPVNKSQDILSRVAKVEITDSRGSGTCMAWPAGNIHYISAAHCFQDVHQHVKVIIGGNTQVGVVGLLDKEHDLASVDVQSPVTGFEIAANVVKEGDKLKFVVFPDDEIRTPIFYNTHNYGEYLIISDDGFQGPKRILSNPVFPGMSGGPVLNNKNQVISVVQSFTHAKSGQWVSLVATYEDFMSFLDKLGINRPPPPPQQ